jgi:hypothetical protein
LRSLQLKALVSRFQIFAKIARQDSDVAEAVSALKAQAVAQIENKSFVGSNRQRL